MKSNFYPCAHCPIRAQYDKNPKSLIGRFWRWQVNWCPVWGSYFKSLTAEEQQTLKEKYNLK